ncbi:META domain-containing protein [Aliarcobacter faecis]|uniref:META domain-containing protein n=1 Tax=Aliarcobacter faecis TaxID=1564138 RepID=UPI00047B4F10|nr:META domain-containing protein [Aliarcobacter faecis]QKF74206.1 META domain-containing protein [Aliarcobacter faecis]
MFKKLNIFLTIFVSVLSLVLISCSSTKGLEVSKVSQNLENTKWELVSLNQKEIKKLDKIASINFEKDNKVFGNLGCNNFFGTYKVNSTNLEIGQVGSTMMMCLDMSVENEYSKVLQNVKGYKMKENNLIFFDENSKEIAKFKKEV